MALLGPCEPDPFEYRLMVPMWVDRRRRRSPSQRSRLLRLVEHAALRTGYDRGTITRAQSNVAQAFDEGQSTL